jgi:hypothetical protein
MRTSRAAVLAAFIPLAACAAAPRAALAPLEPLRHVEAELVVHPAQRGLEQPRFEALSADAAALPERCVSIRVRFVELDARAAEERLGAQATTLVSMVVSGERAEGLLDELRREGRAELVSDTLLALHEDQEGHVGSTSQRAFVSSVSIRTNGAQAAADPEVDVATEGVQLFAAGAPDPGSGRIALALRLEDCRFDSEAAERLVPLAGGHVTLQEPRGLARSLTTRLDLARGEALILGGATLAGASSGRSLFAVVEAEPLAVD